MKIHLYDIARTQGRLEYLTCDDIEYARLPERLGQSGANTEARPTCVGYELQVERVTRNGE